jgi:Lipocalin-like domain
MNFYRAISRLGFIVLLVFTTVPSDAIAQRITKQQLVGTWIFVRTEATQADGTKILPFGPNPRGMLVFTEDGHFAHLQVADGIPKFASNSRVTGTADENKAAVQGSIALSGTYTVDEVVGAFTRNIEATTFPNWTGVSQKLKIESLTAEELIYGNLTGSIAGATTVNIWRRAK